MAPIRRLTGTPGKAWASQESGDKYDFRGDGLTTGLNVVHVATFPLGQGRPQLWK